MILLILGLFFWTFAHVFKRLAPERRAEVTNELGESSKGLFAALIVGSIILMIVGYKAAGGPVWWGRSGALVGINNLLMLLAIYLFAASGAKTWITSKVRNPQLTAFKLWCIAHLLVNGDLASFVLFGGLLGWAIWQVIILNRVTERPEPKTDYPRDKEIKAAVATVVVFAVVAGVHGWLGYSPFGS